MSSQFSSKSTSTSTFTDAYLAYRQRDLKIFMQVYRHANASTLAHNSSKSSVQKACLVTLRDTMERVTYWPLGKGLGGGLVIEATVRANELAHVALKLLPVSQTRAESRKLLHSNEYERSTHQLLTRKNFRQHWSPCLIMADGAFMCRTTQLQKSLETLLEESSPVTRTITEWTTSHPRTVIMPMEKAQYGTLRHYIEHMHPSAGWYQAVVFKLLYSLSCWQHGFPGFRHNDLHLGNVMLLAVPSLLDEMYVVDDVRFRLPVSTVTPCVIDFGRATNVSRRPANLPRPHGYTFLRFATVPFTAEDNYVDVHTLLHELWEFLEEKHLTIPRALLAFLKRAIPEPLRQKDVAMRFTPTEWPPYYAPLARKEWLVSLLQHDPYFQDFRTSDSSASASASAAVGNVWTHPLQTKVSSF